MHITSRVADIPVVVNATTLPTVLVGLKNFARTSPKPTIEMLFFVQRTAQNNDGVMMTSAFYREGRGAKGRGDSFKDAK